MSEPKISIKGGAGDYEASAIAAVIQRVFDERAKTKARPATSNRQAAWVTSGRPPINGEIGAPPRPDPGLNWPER